jgi:hypothetical protein
MIWRNLDHSFKTICLEFEHYRLLPFLRIKKEPYPRFQFAWDIHIIYGGFF